VSNIYSLLLWGKIVLQCRIKIYHFTKIYVILICKIVRFIVAV